MPQIKTRTRCKACEAWMEPGTEFSWMAVGVPVVGGHRGSGEVGYKAGFRPRHAFDCLEAAWHAAAPAARAEWIEKFIETDLGDRAEELADKMMRSAAASRGYIYRT